MRILRSLCAILFGMVLISCAKPQPPEGSVQTSQGIARGIHTGEIISFLGIEYAKAQRWQLPADGPKWEGTQTFDKMGPACPQDNLDYTAEDCLYLNVFAPKGHKHGDKLPVLVWIHGGGLRAGQGDRYMGTFANEGILVVTFNYRLGLLGFHDWLGWDENDPRNFGQADMVKALQWVSDNIENFGGNPENITLMGHSAGGMGVQLMMVDPRAHGLFHRAISDAGYGTWPFPAAANPSPDERTRIRYAGLVLDVPAQDLVARTPYFHLPYIGGVDLPQQPVNVFEAGGQACVPYMSGGNSLDGYGTLQRAGFIAEDLLARYRDNVSVQNAYAPDLAISADIAAARLFGDMRYVYAAWRTGLAMEDIGQPAYLFYNTQPMRDLPGAPHGGHLFGILAEGYTPLERYI